VRAARAIDCPCQNGERFALLDVITVVRVIAVVWLVVHRLPDAHRQREGLSQDPLAYSPRPHNPIFIEPSAAVAPVAVVEAEAAPRRPVFVGTGGGDSPVCAAVAVSCF
jgi:hypothetical protein